MSISADHSEPGRTVKYAPNPYLDHGNDHVSKKATKIKVEDVAMAVCFVEKQKYMIATKTPPSVADAIHMKFCIFPLHPKE